MAVERAELKTFLSGLVVLFTLAIAPASYADDANDNKKKISSKKSMSDILKGCSEREKRSSKALAELMDKLSVASSSNNPEQMKAAIEDSRKTLADLKVDHEKSSQVFQTLHSRVESLKKQIKVSRREHEKAENIVEDSDMDDTVWAY